MPDLQSLPLAYQLPDTQAPKVPSPGHAALSIRTCVRALTGMQKEALVWLSDSAGTRGWRMASDEGPYLNGTDLAPFPLAFFCAGMQFSMMSELLRHAAAHNVAIQSLSLVQDNYYTMEGSALQGTMTGGAKPAEVSVEVEADAPDDQVARLIRLAEQTSPAHAIMRDVMDNTFALTFNGRSLPVTGVRPSPNPGSDDLDEWFAAAIPAGQTSADFITKVRAAEKIAGVEGGAGSSLQAEQKRTLHVHGEARWVRGLLMETAVQLLKPIGSTFRFLCDETAQAGGDESAPSPLAYLMAGVGFCYMTQLGRYAHITKQKLHSYQIIQDNVFGFQGAGWSRSAQAHPVDTHTYIEAAEPEEVAQKTVRMSAQTCFLHAAMRSSNPTLLRATAGGAALAVPGQSFDARTG